MKATGIIRHVDDLGRIVIPKELRRSMNIDSGTPLEIFVNDDQIIVQKYKPNHEKDDVAQKLTALVDHMVQEEHIDLLHRAIKLIK